MKTYEMIGKRWQKSGMDRIYITIDGTIEYNGVYVKNYFNRNEWNNLKVYFDNISNELVVTTGSEEAKEAARYAVSEMMK